MRVADESARASAASARGDHREALRANLRVVALANAHSATVAALGGQLDASAACAKARAHLAVAETYESSRGERLCEDASSRDAAEARTRRGLAQALVHLRLAVAAADPDPRGITRSRACVDALARCKLDARLRLGPRLVAVGEREAALEVARRALEGAALEGTTLRAEDEIAVHLFAADAERASGEAHAEEARDAEDRLRRARRQRRESAAFDFASDDEPFLSKEPNDAPREDPGPEPGPAASAAAAAGRLLWADRSAAAKAAADRAEALEATRAAAAARAEARFGAALARLDAAEARAETLWTPPPPTSNGLRTDLDASDASAAEPGEKARAAEASAALVSRLAAEKSDAIRRETRVGAMARRRDVARARRDWRVAADETAKLLECVEENIRDRDRRVEGARSSARAPILPGTTHAFADADSAIGALEAELAELWIRAKDFEKARFRAERALAACLRANGGEPSPASARAEGTLAFIVARSGRFAEAAAVYRGAVANAKTCGASREDVANLEAALGSACFAASDGSGATEDAAEAETTVRAKSEAAEEGEKKGAPDDALAAANAARRMSKKSRRARSDAAAFLEEAARSFRRAAEGHPRRRDELAARAEAAEEALRAEAEAGVEGGWGGGT